MNKAATWLKDNAKRIYAILFPVDDDFTLCENCGSNQMLSVHHVFQAANRKHSEALGMKIHLCNDCHQKIHKDMDLQLKYKRLYQARFEEIADREIFIAIMGRSYL